MVFQESGMDCGQTTWKRSFTNTGLTTVRSVIISWFLQPGDSNTTALWAWEIPAAETGGAEALCDFLKNESPALWESAGSYLGKWKHPCLSLFLPLLSSQPRLPQSPKRPHLSHKDLQNWGGSAAPLGNSPAEPPRSIPTLQSFLGGAG